MPKTFKSIEPACQCNNCKVDLQWVRSWKNTALTAVFMAVLFTFFMFMINMLKDGGSGLPVATFVGMVLGGSIVSGLIYGKELTKGGKG
ncbi:MAG: hypothetical protein FWH56_03500 [Betaproteobacteria bacterium]|nr:hypothetical protein [Betaproteobacteria bacterium]